MSEKFPRSGGAASAEDDVSTARVEQQNAVEKAKEIDEIYKSNEDFAGFLNKENIYFDELSDKDKNEAYERFNCYSLGKMNRGLTSAIPALNDFIKRHYDSEDNMTDEDLGKAIRIYFDALANVPSETKQGDSNDKQTTEANNSETDAAERARAIEEARAEAVRKKEKARENANSGESREKRRLFKKIGAAILAASMIGGGLALSKNKNENSNTKTIDMNRAYAEAYVDDSDSIYHAEAMDNMENLNILGNYSIKDGFANEEGTGPNPDKIYVDSEGRQRGEFRMANFGPTFKEWLNSNEEGGERDNSIVLDKIMELAQNQPEVAAMLEGGLRINGYESGSTDFEEIENTIEGSTEGYASAIESIGDYFDHIKRIEPGRVEGSCTNFYMRANFDGTPIDSTKVELVQDKNWEEPAVPDGEWNVMVLTAEKDGKEYPIIIKGECVQMMFVPHVEVDVPPVEVTDTPEVTTTVTTPSETTTVTSETTPSVTTVTTAESTTPNTTPVSTTKVTTQTSKVTTPKVTTTTKVTTITATTTTPKVTTTTELTTTSVTIMTKNLDDLAEAMGPYISVEKTSETASSRPSESDYEYDADTGYFKTTIVTTAVPKVSEIIAKAEKEDANGNDLSRNVVTASESYMPVTDNAQRESENVAHVTGTAASDGAEAGRKF